MSALPKTWILDLDGTIVKHNGYKIDGKDSLLSGAKEFLNQIQEEDMVIMDKDMQGKFSYDFVEPDWYSDEEYQKKLYDRSAIIQREHHNKSKSNEISERLFKELIEG